MRAKFGSDPTAGSNFLSFKFISRLGVRSLANASRARQFNPLNPPGVGWVPLPQTNMAAVVGRAWSCAVVRGRARSCVVGHAWSCVVVCGGARSCAVGRARSCAVMRGRACMVGHAWSCVVVRGRAWSCVIGRAWSCAVVRAWSVIRGRAWSCVVVRGRARSVVRGCAWLCAVDRAVLPASRPGLPCCRDTNERTKERTTYNNPPNPPGMGWVKFFYPIKVRVSMGTCVPNLGAIRRPVRKFCLSNL